MLFRAILSLLNAPGGISNGLDQAGTCDIQTVHRGTRSSGQDVFKGSSSLTCKELIPNVPIKHTTAAQAVKTEGAPFLPPRNSGVVGFIP